MTKTNFYAGPGKLPASVLTRIAQELHDYRQSGFSVMEISHRAPLILELIERTQAKFKQLLQLDPQDEVVFLQGGGSLQFAMLTMNLSAPGDAVDYVDTGYWSQKAIAVAQELGRDVQIVAANSAGIPSQLNLRPDAKYLHLCSNNTVMGTQWTEFPTSTGPLVADMSSDLLSRELSMAPFGLVYAHAQKTLGAAGVTVVIIPHATRAKFLPVIPSFLSYETHIQAKSNYHTPPVFAIYVMECVLDWLMDEIGGVAAMEAINRKKAQTLYECLDASALFRCPITPRDRSMMNVVFDLAEPSLTSRLVEAAENQGILGLAGHRHRGGLRASLYNAVTQADVEGLVDFLGEFERTS